MSAKAEYKVMTGDEVVILAGEHRERTAKVTAAAVPGRSRAVRVACRAGTRAGSGHTPAATGQLSDSAIQCDVASATTTGTVLSKASSVVATVGS